MLARESILPVSIPDSDLTVPSSSGAVKRFAVVSDSGLIRIDC